MHHGMVGLFTLGAVFLAVTGAEALYADLGHFGRGPIQLAWLGLVLPALALNYLGQGALVFAHPAAIENPFFLMYPDWALIPMVVLATAATVIASQAVITGAYSLTSQAIQLGLLPRFEIRHTSAQQAGQIYMPRVNGLLLTGVLLLVALFRSSSALASAYGIAVTGTMVVTCMMAFIVIWRLWRWSSLAAAALIVPFLLIDLTFLSANMLKVVQGGWVPLALGGVVMLVMYTWRRGSQASLREDPPARDAARRPGAHAGAQAAGARAGHRGVPHQRSEKRADRADAQPQALQGAAREERHHQRRDHAHAAGGERKARARSSRSARPSCGSGCASVTWRCRTFPGRWRSRASSAGISTSCRRRSFCRAARSAGAAFGHAALAGPPVHLAGAFGQRRHGLFPDPDRPGGRGRHAK